MRLSRIGSSIVIAALIGLSSACSASRSGPDETAQVGKAQAAKVLTGYLAVINRASQAGDGSLAAAVQAEPAAQMSQATYFVARKTGSPPGEALSFRQPEFLIPRLPGYPRWFAVLAASGSGRTAMLVFDQDHRGARWLAAATVTFLNTSQVPSIAMDSQGYAAAVTTGAPSHAAAAHIGCLNSVSGCSALVPGIWTTGVIAAKSHDNTGKWQVRSTFKVTSYPIFALRTTGGGIFTIYSVTEAGSANNTGHGPAVPLDPDASALAGRTTIHKTFTFQTLYQFGSETEPTGKIAVIAARHQMVQATGT